MPRGHIRLPTLFTRDYWRAKAKPMPVCLGLSNGTVLEVGTAVPKDFSTGSVGWHMAGRLSMKVGDATVFVQCNLLLTVCNSAALPREGPGPAAA